MHPQDQRLHLAAELWSTQHQRHWTENAATGMDCCPAVSAMEIQGKLGIIFFFFAPSALIAGSVLASNGLAIPPTSPAFIDCIWPRGPSHQRSIGRSLCLRLGSSGNAEMTLFSIMCLPRLIPSWPNFVPPLFLKVVGLVVEPRRLCEPGSSPRPLSPE